MQDVRLNDDQAAAVRQAIARTTTSGGNGYNVVQCEGGHVAAYLGAGGRLMKWELWDGVRWTFGRYWLGSQRRRGRRSSAYSERTCVCNY